MWRDLPRFRTPPSAKGHSGVLDPFVVAKDPGETLYWASWPVTNLAQSGLLAILIANPTANGTFFPPTLGGVVRLLLLLIILVCSGGGWWFRWRYGGLSGQGPPAAGHGRRHRRSRGHGGPRVYPHQYYTGGAANDYTLPPGYDKDPPSYNEVISHLSQFPRADTLHQGTTAGGSSGGPSEASSVIGPATDSQLAPPPPPYEMVLDLKRREVQLDREIAEEERAERAHSTRGRIKNILGRVRPKRSPEVTPPPLEAYVASGSSQNPVMSPTGLFTISREGLPPQEYYVQPTGQPPGYRRHVPSPSDSESSSHSDYSSSFISSPSSSSRSLSTSSSQDPPEYLPTAPPEAADATTPDPTDQAPSEGQQAALDYAGASRPCTGRSVLSRPTTSISARTLPPPAQLARKTSLPGAVLENDEGDR